MVYLEHPGGRFWRCKKTAAKKVTISYGNSGSAGRTMTKADFGSDADADSYVGKKEASKRKGGYEDAADPNAPPASSGKKRKKSQGTGAMPPSTSSKKVGLRNHAAPDPSDVNEGREIDSGVAGVDAALASRVKVHEKLHAKLALVNPSKNHDKYYILQVLVDDKKKKQKGRKKTSSAGLKYYLFTRWGRTGTGGQAKLEGPWDDDEDTAEESFARIFKSKTGAAWTKAVPGTTPKKDKYQYLNLAKSTGGDSNWYYHLTNDPLGKPDGWYAYDEKNRAETEELYKEYVATSNSSRLSTRLVYSETSGFTYRVDLHNMTQTNTQSGMTRPIQRSTSGEAPSANRENRGKSTPQATPRSALSRSTMPLKSVSAKSPTKKGAPTAAPRSAASPAASSAARGFDEFNIDGGLASLDFFQEDDDRTSMHSTSTASSRKRRIAKVYSSPKKWRRMIRTHRLQSILLRGFY